MTTDPQPLPCPWEPTPEPQLRSLLELNTDNTDAGRTLRAMACEILYLRRVREDLARRVAVLVKTFDPKPN